MTAKTLTELACQARPHADVLREVMDPCRAKSEHEWIAAREIDALAARLVEAERERDQWHADYSRVVAAGDQIVTQLEALREAAWRVCDVCSGGVIDDLRAILQERQPNLCVRCNRPADQHPFATTAAKCCRASRPSTQLCFRTATNNDGTRT